MSTNGNPQKRAMPEVDRVAANRAAIAARRGGAGR
jgi:guanylate kinase